MKALLKMARPLCASVLLLLGLLLGGCVQMFQTLYLAGYDHDISSSTRAIETARDDAHRAAAYTKRGSAYSEKARYSRASRLISPDEYARLFGLAIKDHDQAIALDPASAEGYYWRGQTYYDRAVLEVVVNGLLVGTDAGRKAWFDPAVADFRKAIERDARHYQAWDMLGLSHETLGEFDEAISEYSQELALNPKLGRMRLADAYCERGALAKKRSRMPPLRITRSRSTPAPAPTAARAIPTIRCSDSTPGTGNTTRPGESSTRRGVPRNGSPPNCWIDCRRNPDAATSFAPGRIAHRSIRISFAPP